LKEKEIPNGWQRTRGSPQTGDQVRPPAKEDGEDPDRGEHREEEKVRIGAETSVAFRSAKERPFRGVKGDNTTAIDLPVRTWLQAAQEALGMAARRRDTAA
jgi:hypothetical protein